MREKCDFMLKRSVWFLNAFRKAFNHIKCSMSLWFDWHTKGDTKKSCVFIDNSIQAWKNTHTQSIRETNSCCEIELGKIEREREIQRKFHLKLSCCFLALSQLQFDPSQRFDNAINEKDALIFAMCVCGCHDDFNAIRLSHFITIQN